MTVNPTDALAWNEQGEALRLQNQLQPAEQAYRRAIALDPRLAVAHSNLGVVLANQGRWDEALASCRQAVALDPALTEAYEHIGDIFRIHGHADHAEQSYLRAVELQPGSPTVYVNLGVVQVKQRKFAAAAASYRRALAINPRLLEAHNNLGNTLRELGDLEEAARCFERALQIEPTRLELYNNLGNVLLARGEVETAIAYYQQSLRIAPDYAVGWYNLGSALTIIERYDEATAALRRAIELDPQHVEAHNNLGNVLKAQGDNAGALASYDRALALRPTHRSAHDNVISTEQYLPGVTLARLARRYTTWDELLIAPLRSSWQAHANDRNPDRPLRLGFVSGDFGRHPVGFFLIAALEHLDRRQCEIVCYSNRDRQGELAERFRRAANVWRSVTYTNDEALAAQIRQDRIDLLFDLSGHTGDNRLQLFARKPAPLQITWIGSEGTTGSEAMDYTIVDRYTVPAGCEPLYREHVLRLPDSYFCYSPPSEAPPVGPLPALSRGHVTFCSFNNPAKLNAQVAHTWSEILRQVPGSRLVLRYHGLGEESPRDRLTQLFADAGLASDRLELHPTVTYPEFLACYNEADITLDPFPFSGGATTCESLWMGVPVVTLPGETFPSRHSLCILSTVGRPDLVARDPADYVRIAVALAQDLNSLAAQRGTLRPQMAASPLCDGPRFAANLMETLRDVWRRYCQGLPLRDDRLHT